MSEFFNIDELVSNLHIDLGFNVEVMKPVFKRWAYEALREIGGNRVIEKKTYLILKNLSVQKPKDFIAAKHIYLTRKDDPTKCLEPMYDSSVWCCTKQYGCEDYRVNQTTHSFCFSDNVEPFYSHVLLHYYACPVDDEGNPLIPQDTREAVTAYVTWKYFIRQRNQNSGGPRGTNPVTGYDVHEARKHWLAERRRARGIMNAISERELKEIGNNMMYKVTNAYPQTLNKHIHRFFRQSA